MRSDADSTSFDIKTTRSRGPAARLDCLRRASQRGRPWQSTTRRLIFGSARSTGHCRRTAPPRSSKYETETPTRALASWPARLVAALAIALSAYALYWVVAIIPAQVYRPSFLAITLVSGFCPFSRATTRTAWTRDWLTAVLPVVALGLVFANYFAEATLSSISPRPAGRCWSQRWWSSRSSPISSSGRRAARITPMDWALGIAAMVSLAWPILDLPQFVQRAARPTVTDLVLGTVLIVLVLEATRRTVGWILPATAVAFLLYGFWGAWLDQVGLSILAHRGYELNRLVGTLYMTLEGIFGVPLDVAATYIILFTIYGAVLELSGAGQFFIDWSLAAMGRSRNGAGPGRTVTLAGFLLGSVSGSGVATTVTLGSLTWPLLRRAGYHPDRAGAVLAAGGIGAILSPPTLGAAAFLIAEFLRISYLRCW